MELLTLPLPSRFAASRSGAPRERTENESLQRAVRGLIMRLSPLVARDRRQLARHPLPLLMELTPVDAQTEEEVGSSIIVVGRSISEEGFGFYHQHAIPYRHAIVRVDAGSAGDLCFLVDLTWCRYTRFGWYESGGRFLKLIEPSTAVA